MFKKNSLRYMELFPNIEILDEIIVSNNNCYCLIIKVEPINTSMISEIEKEQIFINYKEMFRSLNVKIRVITRVKPNDIYNEIRVIKETKESLEYIDFLRGLIKDNNLVIREFYIALICESLDYQAANVKLKESFNKVNLYLDKCGNRVERLRGVFLEKFTKETILRNN